ncbi:MAG: hypothetical protein ACE5OR_11070 [bacterium]
MMRIFVVLIVLLMVNVCSVATANDEKAEVAGLCTGPFEDAPPFTEIINNDLKILKNKKNVILHFYSVKAFSSPTEDGNVGFQYFGGDVSKYYFLKELYDNDELVGLGINMTDEADEDGVFPYSNCCLNLLTSCMIRGIDQEKIDDVFYGRLIFDLNEEAFRRFRVDEKKPHPTTIFFKNGEEVCRFIGQEPKVKDLFIKHYVKGESKLLK